MTQGSSARRFSFKARRTIVSDVVLAIEQSFDVLALRYKGMPIWPQVRSYLYHHLKNLPPEQFSSLPAVELTRMMHERIDSAANPLATDADIAGMILEKNAKRCLPYGIDVMMLSDGGEYKTLTDGLRHNPYVDPYASAFRACQATVCKVEMLTSQSQPQSPNKEPSVYVAPPPMDIGSVLRCAPRVEGYDQLAKAMRLNGLTPVPEVFIPEQVEPILILAEMWKEILHSLCPRLVTTSCYYYQHSFALIKACRDLSIPVIDLQHGGNGDLHLSYFHFTQAPPDGFDFMPDFFWVWNDYFKYRIERAFDASVSCHRAIVGGNLNLARYDSGAALLPSGHESFAAKLGMWERVILVAPSILFNAGSALGMFIDAMGIAPKNWLWILRAHPIDHKPCDIADWQRELTAQGLTNWMMDGIHDMPLGALLPHCDHVVTTWSGICFDALRWNVPTTFTSDFAWEATPEGLDRGYFFLANSAQDLVASIDAHRRGDIHGGDATPVTDAGRAKVALNILLGRSAG